MRRLAQGLAAVIRVDALWMATQPLDMRAGTDTLLARIVEVFGEARAHHAYLFANRRATRMKLLVHDGIGISLANRRLNQGHFVWPREAGERAPEPRSVRRPRAGAAVAAHWRNGCHLRGIGQPS